MNPLDNLINAKLMSQNFPNTFEYIDYTSKFIDSLPRMVKISNGRERFWVNVLGRTMRGVIIEYGPFRELVIPVEYIYEVSDD